jgi:LysR family transcriptional regulator, glycine cleavage system transcriptional activator
MTKSHLPLKALAGFRAAARLNSFQAAARALGVTPSAISHQVAQIEDYFGAPVFVRATRSVSLTRLGRGVLKTADRLYSEMERLRAKAASRSALRVSALPLFTQAWLMPRIAKFSALYPDIEVAITSEHQVADLQAGEADIAIRSLRAKPSGLAARKLMELRGVPVCSPALKAGRVPLETPADLARHTLIQYSSRPDAWDVWFAAQGLQHVKPRKTLTVDTVPAALEAAARGAGIALGTDPLMWAADVAKGLVKAVAAKTVSESSYFVCTTRARARDRQVVAFTDWLFREAATRTA